MEKHRKFNISLYMCFVDYEKAFDWGGCQILWKILLECGVPQHLVIAIQSIYICTGIKVKVQSLKYTQINQGVLQGCPLSPFLFNTYVDEMICECGGICRKILILTACLDSKTEICGFIGEEPRRTKFVVNDMPFEQVNSFC